MVYVIFFVLNFFTVLVALYVYTRITEKAKLDARSKKETNDLTKKEMREIGLGILKIIHKPYVSFSAEDFSKLSYFALRLEDYDADIKWYLTTYGMFMHIAKRPKGKAASRLFKRKKIHKKDIDSGNYGVKILRSTGDITLTPPDTKIKLTKFANKLAGNLKD